MGGFLVNGCLFFRNESIFPKIRVVYENRSLFFKIGIFSKMGVCFLKMGVFEFKIGVFFENRCLFFRNGILFFPKNESFLS